MKFNVFIFSLFVYFNTNAQVSTTKLEASTINTGLSNEELTIACDKYKIMLETSTYIENESKARAFAEKIQDYIIEKNIPFDSIKDKTSTLKLIANNLKKTKFKSIEEAEIFIDDMAATDEKLVKENKLLFELIDKATVDQRGIIFQPLFVKTRKEILGY